MKALFEGIYSHFSNDPLSGMVSGLYNTKAPSDVQMPFIVFTLISDTKLTTMQSVMEDFIIEFAIYSDNASSNEACNIFEALKGDVDEGLGFDFYELIVKEHDTLVLQRQVASLEYEEKIWTYRVTYKMLLLYSGSNAVIVPTAVSNFYNLLSIY